MRLIDIIGLFHGRHHLKCFLTVNKRNTSKGFENDDLHIKHQRQTDFGENILKVTDTYNQFISISNKLSSPSSNILYERQITFYER